MQKVVRSNGMVHVSLPSTEEGKNNHHKKELNSLNENMASRLAALTKALKDKIPHKNGVINTQIKPREMKTEAKPTCINGVSLTNSISSDSSPDYIAKHCAGLVKQTILKLSSSQSEIEHRVTKSLFTLRHRQLAMSHSHSVCQIESQEPTTSDNFTGLCRNDSSFSNEATPPSGSPSTSIHSNHSSIDRSFTSLCVPDSSSHENTSIASFTIQKHLQGLGSFVDDEATCSSSDEEEDSVLVNKRLQLKRPKLVKLIIAS